MWKFVGLVVLASLAFQASAEEPEQNKAAIRAKMSELAGTAAVNCGLLERGGPLASAWKCAQAADSAKKPFWLALEESRTDSAVWLAVARGPNGKRYAIFYTSNEYGQMDFKPHFTVTVCNEPFQLFEDSMFILRCGPDVP
jgi:hypothetical protein